MNKLFTFALAAAFSTTAVQAQILKYGAEAGETAPDTVNWYGNWVEAGGQIEFGNSDAATGSGAIYVNTPEEAGAANDWERVLKFDGLKIEANKNYRVRLSAKAASDAILGVALMCGDENCDMPFVIPNANGGYTQQKKELKGFNDADYSTKSAIFRYTTDEYQQQIYPNIKADDPNGLGANRFLRLTVKSVGEYYIDDVIVEEAAIAGCYYNMDCVKVDFGFSTNIAQLVKEYGGVISLDPSCAKVIVDGTAATVEAVELKADGNLYIFTKDEIDGKTVTVSFDASNSGIKYSGTETPGDGVAVPSFEGEITYLDESFYVESTLYEAPKLVTSNPKDNSFELDEEIKEFTFTFDKDIYLKGDKAPKVSIYGGSITKARSLTLKEGDAEFGRTVTFLCDFKLPKATYGIDVTHVYSHKDIPLEEDIALTIETGKVSVAGIEYTEVANIDIKGGDGEGQPDNWSSYFNGEEATGGIRVFDFAEGGPFTKGYYLSQRDAAELGTSLTYGEKADYPFELPAGDIQIDIYAAQWQGNSGSFLYELVNEAGEAVVSGSAVANFVQENKGITANPGTITFKYEGCKGGKYVLRLTTNTGGYGNAIIVFGAKVSTYKIGQGETADSQTIVDGSFANVGNDCTPDEGDGWTIYEIRNGEVVACEKGSTTGIGQRARFFVYSNVPNLPVAYYNRNLGGDAETSYYMTYGETEQNEPALMLDEARYSFTWYCVNWKGDNNDYYFKIIDVEDNNKVVCEKQVNVAVNVNGDRSSKVEPVKVDFQWTAPHYGQYILKWYMTGESSLGNIKIEQMGSQAAYWHTQLNNAIAVAEEELGKVQGDQYAGATRDALQKAVDDAKNITLHTGEEYTQAIEDLNQYVKDMDLRYTAIGDYDSALAQLASQTESMAGSKYENLDSYKQAVQYIEKYSTVAAYTIENETLLPLVEDMQTLYTLNTRLMASGTGVEVLTDQVNKLANTYIKLDAINNGDESIAFIDDTVLEAQDQEVYDNQDLAGRLKKMVTGALYKAIANGYNFKDLEYPDEEPSEDNPYVDVALDLTGFIQNSVFYTTTPKDVSQPANQAASDGTCPGWTFNAPNGYAADWGWGGWTAPNQPCPPLNIANSQVGTRWGCNVEVYQTLNELPVGIYQLGGYCTDRSYVTSDNVLEEGQTTPSYIYVKQAGMDEVRKPFSVENIGQYYGMTLTLIEDITVEPVSGTLAGKATLGANVIFAGEAASDYKGGFAGFDNAQALMAAKHPTFDYAAAAKQIENEISTAIQAPVNNADVVKTEYFDLNGRKVANAKGIFIRVQTMVDGSQKAVKVLRR